MKKVLSLVLALILVISAVMVMPTSAFAADTFKAGDVLYLKVESPHEWAGMGEILYANFTESSRADNGDTSVIIATADKSKYNPVTGVTKDEENGLYKYVVTDSDAGSTAMRFWRGNDEKLWNDSVVLRASDFAQGLNTCVVTDWSDTGRLESTFSESVTATLTLSKNTAEVNEQVDISLTNSEVTFGNVNYEIFIDGESVTKANSFPFIPSQNGTYSIEGIVSVTDNNGKVLAMDKKSATLKVGTVDITIAKANNLYAYGTNTQTPDTESWVRWKKVNNTYYFFMPNSMAKENEFIVYNTFSSGVKINNTTVPAGEYAKVAAEKNKQYDVSINGNTYRVMFKVSSAEAALFVNNMADFNGMDMHTYLIQDKNNSVSATGAINGANGSSEVVTIKKVKGRGNTSWTNTDKKGFNVTFDSAVSLDGMQKCKKFSLISSFQDASLARNRILYDLADAAKVPYASDSRFTEIYFNGEYQGNYMMCEKVDVGKNTLIPDVASDDYLDKETGAVKSDFSFVCEIDASPSADDFNFKVGDYSITMKSPELDAADPNIANVRGYVKQKFSAMIDKLKANTPDLNNYIDVESLAKVYLINELGKNWDSGVTSFYFVYKPDQDGNYKFFASPVWDYDNSLGNAKGVQSDLDRYRVKDYTLPTGWWANIKGGSSCVPVLASKNTYVMEAVYKTWFEDFVPAIETLKSTGVTKGEIFSHDTYFNFLEKAADMNYTIWELYSESFWIANHSSLTKGYANYSYNQYGQITGVNYSTAPSKSAYDQNTFEGQYDYMIDWTTSRAAWISSEYISHYTPEPPQPTEPTTEAPTEQPTEAPTEEPTEHEDEPMPDIDLNSAIAAWVFDSKGKVSGDKLTEYGNADNGYKATKGDGLLTMSVNGTKNRALEWSSAEYGQSEKAIVPIMGAGSKNQWGTPYIKIDLSSKGYEKLRFTMYLGGSSKAPASWKLQYSTDGENYKDVSNAKFTIKLDDRKQYKAYFNLTSIPADAEDCETLSFKIIPQSMTTIDGSNALDNPASGELALNYIVVNATPKGGYIRGDANLSGNVDILDATAIQRHLATLKPLLPLGEKAADVDDDGFVSIVDVTKIQRYLAKIIDVL